MWFDEKPHLPYGTIASGPPSTAADLFKVNFDSRQDIENWNSTERMLEEIYDRRNKEIMDATGKELPNPMRAARPTSTMDGFDLDPTPFDPEGDWQRSLKELAGQYPDKAGLLQPDFAPRDEIRQRRRESEERMMDALSRRGRIEWNAIPFVSPLAAEVANLAYDPVGSAAIMAGQMAGMYNSPVDVIPNLFIGLAGGPTQSLLKNALKAAVSNVALQAAYEPGVQARRADAGLEAGWEQAFQNLAGAFVMGGVIDPVIRAPIRYGRIAAGSTETFGGVFRDAPTPTPKLPGDLTPETLNQALAGDQAAVDKVVDAMGLRDNPTVRGALQQIEQEVGIRAEGVDGPDADLALSQAIAAVLNPREPLPGPFDPELDGVRQQRVVAIEAELETLRQGGVENADRIATLEQERARLRNELEAKAREAAIADDAPETVQKLTADGKPVSGTRIKTADLTVDRQQFPSRSSPEALANRPGWDPLAAGRILVWERSDGSKVVVDGRNRVDYAKKTGTEEVEGYVYREADGWTAGDMQVQAALKSLRDGKITDPVDAALVLRARPELVTRDLAANGQKSKLVRSLTRLSPAAFERVVAGEVEPVWGGMVADLVARADQHDRILTDLAALNPRTQREGRLAIAELLRVPRDAATHAMILDVEAGYGPGVLEARVAVLDIAMRDLQTDKRTFDTVVKQAQRLVEEGNQLLPTANVARAGANELAMGMLNYLVNQGGPVANLLNEAALAVATQGLAPKLAGAAFAGRLRQIMQGDVLASVFKAQEPPLRIDEPWGKDALRQVEEAEAALQRNIEAARNAGARQAADDARMEAQRLQAQLERARENLARLESELERTPIAEAGTLTPDEVESVVSMWQFVDEMDRAPKPERLTAFIRRMGGVKDDGGDIRSAMGGARELPGLVNNRTGLELDRAARLAWDEGYLIAAERPTINDLLDAIDRDQRGDWVTRADDAARMEDFDAAERMRADLARLGVDDARSESEVRAYLTREGDQGAGDRGPAPSRTAELYAVRDQYQALERAYREAQSRASEARSLTLDDDNEALFALARFEDENPLNREAKAVTQALRSLEDAMKREGRNATEIAAEIKQQFGLDVDPERIESGEVWWRIGDVMRREADLADLMGRTELETLGNLGEDIYVDLDRLEAPELPEGIDPAELVSRINERPDAPQIMADIAANPQDAPRIIGLALTDEIVARATQMYLEQDMGPAEIAATLMRETRKYVRLDQLTKLLSEADQRARGSNQRRVWSEVMTEMIQNVAERMTSGVKLAEQLGLRAQQVYNRRSDLKKAGKAVPELAGTWKAEDRLWWGENPEAVAALQSPEIRRMTAPDAAEVLGKQFGAKLTPLSIRSARSRYEAGRIKLPELRTKKQSKDGAPPLYYYVDNGERVYLGTNPEVAKQKFNDYIRRSFELDDDETLFALPRDTNEPDADGLREAVQGTGRDATGGRPGEGGTLSPGRPGDEASGTVRIPVGTDGAYARLEFTGTGADGSRSWYLKVYRPTAKALPSDDSPKATRIRMMQAVGNQVATMELTERAAGPWDNGNGSFLLTTQNVEVRADMRQQGIGRSLYDAVEQHFGVQLVPSGFLKEGGFKFWQKRNPDAVKHYQYIPHQDIYMSPNQILGHYKYARKLMQFETDIALRGKLRKEIGEYKTAIDAIDWAEVTDASLATQFSLPRTMDMSPEARKARAAAEGFDTGTVYYHGTMAPTFDAFSAQAQSGGERGVYLTPDRNVANIFAGSLERSPDRGRVIPAYVRGNMADLSNPATVEAIGAAMDEMMGWQPGVGRRQVEQRSSQGRLDWAYRQGIRAAREAGFDGVHLNDADGPSIIVFDPSNIRSVNAEFDPAQSRSRNIMSALPRAGEAPSGIEIGKYGFTPDAQSRIALIRERVQAVFDRLPTAVKGNLIDSLTYGGKDVDGTFNPTDAMVWVSLRAQDPERVAMHEEIHVLRKLKVLTDDEYNVLVEHTIQAGHRKSYEIDKRYKKIYERKFGKGARLEQALVEETVAEMAADYKTGTRFSPAVDRILGKIIDVLDQVFRAVSGLGFRQVTDMFRPVLSVEQVMQRIRSGEVGRRPADLSGLGRRDGTGQILQQDRATGQAMRRELDSLGFYSKLDEVLGTFGPKDKVTVQTLAQRGVKASELEARGLMPLFSAKPSLTELSQHIARHVGAMAETIKKELQKPHPRLSRTNDKGLTVLLTKSPDGAGDFRITRFQNGEPIGHSDFRADDRSIRTAAQELAGPAGKPAVAVPVADLRAAAEQNKVQLKETQRGNSDVLFKQLKAVFVADGHKEHEAQRFARMVFEGEHKAEELSFNPEAKRIADQFLPPSKWANYSLDPSNPTYRETVIHLPDQPKERNLAEMRARLEGAGFSGDALDRMMASQEAQENSASQAFRSGHFPEPNIVGHLMTSMTTHQGKSVFTVDQIQSDWGQKLRDGGVRDEAKIAELTKRVAESEDRLEAAGIEYDAAYQALPRAFREATQNTPATNIVRRLRELGAGDDTGAFERYGKALEENRLLRAELNTAVGATPGNPLVNTTDQWVTTTLRRAITQAVEADADYIAIPSGDTVLGYNPGDTNGMREFYGATRVRDAARLAEVEAKLPDARRALKAAEDASDETRARNAKQTTPNSAKELVGAREAVKAAYRVVDDLLKQKAALEEASDKLMTGIVPKNLAKLLGTKGERIDTLDSPSGKTGLGKGFTLFPLTPEMKAKVRDEGMPMFSFAGEKSVGADTAKLAKAKDMMTAGASREDIWRDTGWFQGVDGRWRYEITDRAWIAENEDGSYRETGMRMLANDALGDLLDGKVDDVLLADIVKHEDLFAAYPEMAQYSVMRDETRLASYGSSVFTMGKDFLRQRMNPVKTEDITKPTRVMLHEIQHAIQDFEEFARGGSPGEFTKELLDMERARMLSKSGDATGWTSVGTTAGDMPDHQVALLLYRRLAGEVESRAVESRMRMTEEERRRIPPWKSYDVPEDLQIVRRNGERVTSLMDDGTLASGLQETDRLTTEADLISVCRR